MYSDGSKIFRGYMRDLLIEGLFYTPSIHTDDDSGFDLWNVLVCMLTPPRAGNSLKNLQSSQGSISLAAPRTPGMTMSQGD